MALRYHADAPPSLVDQPGDDVRADVGLAGAGRALHRQIRAVEANNRSLDVVNRHPGFWEPARRQPRRQASQQVERRQRRKIAARVEHCLRDLADGPVDVAHRHRVAGHQRHRQHRMLAGVLGEGLVDDDDVAALGVEVDRLHHDAGAAAAKQGVDRHVVAAVDRRVEHRLDLRARTGLAAGAPPADKPHLPVRP